EAYLNGLYFGNGIYGIKNAAKMFFDKDLKSLNLSECATIAAVVKNPSRFSPLKNPQNSYERRNLILRQMKDNNFITEEQELAARVKKISVSDKKHEETINAAYVEGVLDEASKITGLTTKELLLSEYKIYTYFDEQEQKILYGAVTDEAHLLKNKNGKLPDAMSMIVDNHDGGINAFYINSYINNIFDLRRQPGSAAKPIFVYAPAFSENLITPLTKIDDVKKSFDGYSPSNFKEKYAGRTTVRNLVMQSSNVSAVEILKMLTVEKSKAFALTMGIELDKSDGVNIALGGLRRGLTPIELISGYTMLANSGNYKDIGFIKKICDQNGNLIYEKGLSYKSIISAEDAYIMTDILKDTAKRGTAKLLSPLTFDTASKTGTVSNNTDKSLNNDAWNLSYTTCHTILCWQGNLSNKTENALSSQVTGGGYPTLVAKEILSKLYTGFLPADFERPDGIVDYDGDILKVSDIMRAKNEDSRIDM
ncbi:MAG: transglycosylase domain-containing protein, partial [Clostridiales bacterium]|nr:transglycosylase domain-containing protein [Clostridiales bacterium]